MGTIRENLKDKAILKITIRKYIMTTIGCAVCAFGFVSFIQVGNITTGGVAGIANLLSRFIPLPTGVLLLLLNVPLFILSFIFLTPKFTIRTLYGTILLSLFMTAAEDVLSPILPLTENIIINCICGGVIFGTGLGIIMKNGASTGGSDIVMKLIHRHYRYLKGGLINTCIDGAIIIAFFFITKDFEMTFFALASVIIQNAIYDLVLYGFSNSKTVYIITTKADELVPKILTDVHAGATISGCTGAYSKEGKTQITCTVRNNSFPTLRHEVQKVDPKAFMIVVKSYEIYGEGYKSYEDVL